MDDPDIFFRQSGNAHADGIIHPQKVVCGHFEHSGQLHNVLCGGDRDANLPFVDTGPSDPQLLCKIGLCHALMLPQMFDSFCNHSITS